MENKEKVNVTKVSGGAIQALTPLCSHCGIGIVVDGNKGKCPECGAEYEKKFGIWSPVWSKPETSSWSPVSKDAKK